VYNLKLNAWQHYLRSSRLPISIFYIGFVFSVPNQSSALESQKQVLEAVVHKNSLEVQIYKIKHALPEVLIGMAEHIMQMIVQDQPFKMTYQSLSHEIFIESTPDLNTKAMSILACLDDPTKNEVFQFGNLLSSVQKSLDLASTPSPISFFFYQPKYFYHEMIEGYLHNLPIEANEDLKKSIASMHWVDTIQTLVFEGSSSSIQKLQKLLHHFDAVDDYFLLSDNNLLFYTLQNVNREKIEQYLDSLVESLEKTEQNRELVEAVKTKQWVSHSHSFLFWGPDKALVVIKDILSAYDRSMSSETFSFNPIYFVYKREGLADLSIKEPFLKTDTQEESKINESDVTIEIAVRDTEIVAKNQNSSDNSLQLAEISSVENPSLCTEGQSLASCSRVDYLKESVPSDICNLPLTARGKYCSYQSNNACGFSNSYRSVCSGSNALAPLDYIAFDFDALYFKAVQDNLKYAETNTMDLSPAGNSVLQKFSYKWGMRIGVNIPVYYDEWEVDAIYTYFHPKMPTTTKIDGNQFLFMSLTQTYFPQVNNGSNVQCGFVQGDWHLKMDVVDSIIKRPFLIGKSLMIAPSFGIKGSLLRQHMVVYYNNIYVINGAVAGPLGLSPLTNPLKVISKSEVFGVGPELGAEMKLLIPKEFSVFVKGSFSSMFGRFKTTTKYTNLLNYFGVYPNITVSNSNINNIMRENITRSFSMMQLQGAVSKWWLIGSNASLEILLGWESQFWWSQNRLNWFSTIALPSEGADLMVQGPFGQINFTF
jgi:hypothetical protein